MKKYIVLSVNDNPDYLYWTPLTCYLWRKFGWEPILMYYGDLKWLAYTSDYPGGDCLAIPIQNIDGYRSDTITQISRLYAGNIWSFSKNAPQDGYLMTGDIDLLPLSDYWKPNFEVPTVWGHDLTGYGHYPICFIGMSAAKWRQVMNLRDGLGQIEKHIKRDLDQMPQAKTPDFYKYWFTDQDLITERLKPYNPVHVLRGQYANGYAVGRVDRGAWSLSHETLIDAHLPQQVYHKGREKYFDDLMGLLHHIWPEEDWGWWYDFTIEFRKLTGHG